MNMIKTVMTGAVAMALVSFGANAANQGQGVINFKGSVIDAACGIAPESADQSIDFGQINKSHLNANGLSTPENFDIKLVNCEPNKTVKVLFSGTTLPGDAKALGTAGGTGTAIVLSGQDGALVSFGTESAPQSLKEGENILRYSSWVKAASNGSATEGEFTAVANFNMIYD